MSKRLLVFADEFSSVLRVMTREASTLSTTLRQAFDGRTLEVLTKKLPLRAVDAHISIVAQITEADLRRYLSKTEIFNGFGNRFLWVCVDRSKFLPEGGELPAEEFRKLIKRLKSAVQFSKGMSEIRFSTKARKLWVEVYPELSADVPGVLGAVTSRAETQVRRIAVIYALMSKSKKVWVQHLRAALEVWRFCRESAEYIFNDHTAPSMDERLLLVIPRTGKGISRTSISRAFSNHNGHEIATSLANLKKMGFIESTSVTTKGRKAEYWLKTSPKKNEDAKG